MNLSTMTRQMIYALFALSGFSALVYEVLWTKHLALSFGATMPAVSIVTATFMGGLALGSYLIGRHADNERHQLRLYALLEAAIAGMALLFPPTLAIINQAHIFVERALPDHPLWAHALHFASAAILLLPPAVCMGGTFPLICRFFARKKSGGQIGRLYAFNTFGATFGVLTTGFILIPSFGLTVTNLFAVALNLLIAASAWVLSHKVSAAPQTHIATESVDPPLQPKQHWPVLLAIGLIGACSLAYEILWTRVFLLFLGNTTYAFSLILGAFLIGIALGGAIYARKVHSRLNEHQVMARLTVLMGASVLCTAPFYDHLADLFLWAHNVSGDNWWILSFLSFAIALVVMALPTLLSGSLLPAASAILQTGRSHTGRGVGLVVLFNSTGGMLGGLLAGFLLIPLIGTEISLRIVAGGNLFLGLWLCWYFRRSISTPWPQFAVAALALVALLLPQRWDQKLLNSGVYCYAKTYANYGGIRYLTGPERILEVIEGLETTVAVKEIDVPVPARYFSVNGKTDGGNGGDMATQILVGQLPLLLHPAPQRAMVIGLGTGITLGSVAASPLTHIDCAEISQEVVTASRYFERENRQVLTDPRVKLMVEDGRDLLQIKEQKYDVIVSQPSNPWQSGNANLFTSEFYRLAASRLNADGIFSQWIGLYDITPENLKVAAQTLLEIFPYTLTFKSGGDLIILASHSPLQIDYRLLTSKLSVVKILDNLASTDIRTPGDLLARHFLLDDSTLRRFAAGAEINTDYRPILEFSFRYNIGGKMFSELKKTNLATLSGISAEQSVPLSNLGTSENEVADALRELSDGYGRAGKHKEADFFRIKIDDYQSPADKTDKNS